MFINVEYGENIVKHVLLKTRIGTFAERFRMNRGVGIWRGKNRQSHRPRRGGAGFWCQSCEGLLICAIWYLKYLRTVTMHVNCCSVPLVMLLCHVFFSLISLSLFLQCFNTSWLNRILSSVYSSWFIVLCGLQELKNRLDEWILFLI